MAVDAARPFENDDAIDFLIELADDPSFELLADAIRAVITTPHVDYLDVDLGACAVAAVEVLVRAQGGGEPEGPLRTQTLAALKKALAEQPAARRAWAVESARAAIERATGAHSELADLWDEVFGKKKTSGAPTSNGSTSALLGCTTRSRPASRGSGRRDCRGKRSSTARRGTSKSSRVTRAGVSMAW